MSNVIHLPARLSRDGDLDIAQANQTLRDGNAGLDWSATRDVEPEALHLLLAGLDLVEDGDLLGIDTIRESLVDRIGDVFDAQREHERKRRSKTVRASGATKQPGPNVVPAVWTSPALVEDGAGDSGDNTASDQRGDATTSISAAVVSPPSPLSPAAIPLLAPPSPSAIRDELERLVLADLLGPAGGDDEEIEDRPRDRYLVGKLAPHGQRVEPEEQDELAEGGAEGVEEGPVEQTVAQMPTLFPSSFGLSCCIDRDAHACVVSVSWGTYERGHSETATTSTGAAKLVWKRAPHGGTSGPLPLVAGKLPEWSPDPAQPDIRVRGVIREADTGWLVTLWLLNEQDEPKTLRDTAWMFQPVLSVTSTDGAAIFRRRPYRKLTGGDSVAQTEDHAMAMRYRHTLEFAVGHGVGVQAEQQPGETACATRVTTRVVPEYELPATTSADASDYPALTDVILDMAAIATLPSGGFASALTPLLTAYDDWIARQEQRIDDPAEDLTESAADARAALAACREARARISDGIALLDTNPQAADAFRFANAAMSEQRIRALIVEARRGGHPADRASIDVPHNRSWRLFQLAFILLNLPSLTDLHHPDRSPLPTAGADLLWFPTGGGKTEAYLGLTAYTLAIRRLQGTVAGRSGMDGVAVLMRYTLRLLTLQQFQRAAALLCACEMIRRDAHAKGDHRWGTTPFRLGLWVGQRTTPNTTYDANEAVKKGHGAWTGNQGGSGSPAQLATCPWCGSTIDPGKQITVDKERKRTFIYCGDPLGDCPFSAKRAPNEGLPVIVVDEEIYRNLPALLISTVDKFAQMPWKGETQMLFGQVDGYCRRHGFRSPELEDSNSHPARNGLPPVKTLPHGPLRPPDLIIQDELHLISGPLGTLVGLYETVVDRLCSWDVDGQRVRPKVIASTATVRRANDQMHALFLRKVAVFPPQGLDAGDNFFALQRPLSDEQPGRKYIGICAPGVRLKAVLIRVYVAHLAAAQLLYEKYGAHADPWMTLVGYFNAMRELGGMRRLVDDDVRARLTRTHERGLAKRTKLQVEELTSRKSSTDIPRVLQELETGFDPARNQQVKPGMKHDWLTPIDVLLATNMLSVGVDVSRLGLMVVAGQPKTTAEYIQATSRVGRRYPGLVCTVLNWARPRDLSHYEQFEHYHATFYQHVEALSVTPFSARAIDRGLSGLLVAYVRLIETAFNDNDRASKLSWANPYVKQAIVDIAERAGLVKGSQTVAQQVKDELGTRVDAWISQAQHISGGSTLGYKTKKDGVTQGLLLQPDTDDWQTFTCLNSLRDVEPTVGLVLDTHGQGSYDVRPFTKMPSAPVLVADSAPTISEE